jgi:hypothetical protein
MIGVAVAVAACDRDDAPSTPRASSGAVKKTSKPKSSAEGAPAKSGAKAETDLSGEWSYTTSNQKVKGSCPKGSDSQGKLKLTRSGGGYQLRFLSGRGCRPVEMCTFKGSLDGKELSLNNGGQVDEEGGTASNTLTLTVDSPKKLTGEGTSRYAHPGGMVCNWTYDVVVQR